MDFKKIIAGAVSGFVSALLVDLNAWKKASGAFAWGLAVQRWAMGAVSGGMAALGMGQL